MIIKNLYDSHIHLLMTGECLQQLNLSQLKNESDLLNISREKNYLRGKWLIGFGWDENHFEPGFSLNRKNLDQLFPDKYVFFVRADGHSCWVNTAVLNLIGVDTHSSSSWYAMKEFIGVGTDGLPSGLLKESIHMKVYEHLPAYQKPQIKSLIQTAIRHFHSEGFTHMRDMTTRWDQWEACLEMHEAKEFNVFVEHNFSCENLHDLDRALKEIKQAKATENSHMKARGIKLFYDGSLGSRTAFLSENYADDEENHGQTLWKKSEVKELISRTWRENFDVSVHAIGDQAAHEIVEISRQISAEGITGRLNLEHVQVLKPETVKLMKALHVVCHLQPCHWLSDKVWLKERLGSLHKYAFPWESLRKAGIQMHFGSDSPIEKPSLARNLRALKESGKAGLRPLSGDPISHHTFSSSSVPAGESHFKQKDESDFSVEKVFFNQKIVYQA